MEAGLDKKGVYRLGGKQMFNDWLNLLVKLSENGYTTKDFICPECGQKSVESVYVGDPVTRIGYLPAWCSSCNRGIQISRVEIPQGVHMLEFGDLEGIKNTIPNFKQIIPSKKQEWRRKNNG